ncbi:chromosome segregation protein SMC [Comamonas thiooxydans]|uniref:AAA family ATPase n=1 Tax=Comamonas thiooxydans TaxID=363952 RepID=UPI001E2A45F9|nr:AAA family ATPase [Comamonas thiooxydans]BDB69046.1 chromosome segregation protein SMC [Comamonas thiooxydans]
MADFRTPGIEQREPEPARIKSVTIEGFRSLRSIQNLELPQLAVLIGANGAGKSTLIRFFEMLSWMLKSKSLQEFVLRQGGGDDQFFMGARKTPRIHAELCLATKTGLNDYRFDLAHVSGGDSVIVMNEAYRYAPNSLQTEAKWTELGAVGKESALLDKRDKTAKTVVNLLRQCSTYQFHDTSPNSAIHNRWDITESFRLRSDGGNLAAVLLNLRSTDGKRYELIVKQIRRVLPVFKDFVLEEEAGKVLLRWVGNQSDKVFGSHLTSDGSLRLFCLLTLLNMPPERLPDVMLFDEPELGLHPHAVSLVAEMFKRLSKKRQIFLATQSPYMVDCFEMENIIIASANQGETLLRNLPREQYQNWLDDEYQLSDIWLKQVVGGME